MARIRCRAPHPWLAIEHIGHIITREIPLRKVKARCHRQQMFEREIGVHFRYGCASSACCLECGHDRIVEPQTTLINLPPDKGRHQAFIHGPALHGRFSSDRGPVALCDCLPAMHNNDRKGISASLGGLGEGGIQSGFQRCTLPTL